LQAFQDGPRRGRHPIVVADLVAQLLDCRRQLEQRPIGRALGIAMLLQDLEQPVERRPGYSGLLLELDNGARSALIEDLDQAKHSLGTDVAHNRTPAAM
jgi:hypothetical protein